ncbi:Uncharacterised protein [Chryseobacterium nakagawai]|uniref:Uncharacterized protein n=1 Tax=Chryseobacterium nakagawai TaxID=1241982 RepID=A0AAD1DT46_CHRNA|nr:hypothetical protein [Chryseobacterium nakagawai]AZA93588.1 hypothetical protein EG343_24770 [Chryseobacterium nakagawai]VEH20289.1 Uncharacterised protein [Chryseobacterium nakagawai]
MNKLFLWAGIILSTSLYSQENISFDRATQLFDFIEVSFKLENKPNDKFHLIKFDTITASAKKGILLIENGDIKNIYRRANILARYELPKEPLKTVNAKGIVKYFKPSKENNSYFILGKVQDLKKDVNLIDKSILVKNSRLYFGIVSIESANKTFKDFISHKSNQGKSVDFNDYDLIIAVINDKEHEIIPVVTSMDDELDFGYHNITIKDPKTGIVYTFYKINKSMTTKQRGDIPLELFIENEESVQKIPFDFKNFQVKQ